MEYYVTSHKMRRSKDCRLWAGKELPFSIVIRAMEVMYYSNAKQT